MAIVSLVLTSIALAKGDVPLIVAADVVMILSTSIRIFSMVAGWVVAAGFSCTL